MSPKVPSGLFSRERGGGGASRRYRRKGIPRECPAQGKEGQIGAKKSAPEQTAFFSCFSAVWLRGTSDTFLGPPSREVWLQGVLLRLTGPMPRLCHKTPVSIIVPDIRTTDTTSKREERKGACLPPVPHIKMRDIYFSPFIVFLRRAE